MKTTRFGLSGLTLALLVLAPPALGQYMYLDSNGDGVHTAADQVHALGPTVIDIWLDIGHNRDGSVAVCTANPAKTLDMFSYMVTLQILGGALSYSTFTNRLSQMGPFEPSRSDSSHYSTGSYFAPFGAPSLPPGKYLLGTVTVSITSGAPSIQIAPGTTTWTNPYAQSYTMFGSNCEGSIGFNTILLGTDWFDADGLPYGTGGGPNQSPVLSPPADMTVLAGENATQTITASDAEGQPLTFAKASGPPFMVVTTTDVGAGAARGEIRLAPFSSDIGSPGGGVSVTDGTSSDQASFGITVSATANHVPSLTPIPKVSVVGGQVAKLLLSAGDADGGTLHIIKTSGPAYVRVRELAARYGGSSAVLTATPTVCDVGPAAAAISVTDGVSLGELQIDLSVVPPSSPPDSTWLHFEDPESQLQAAIGLGDLNGDGNLDVVVTHENKSTISVLLGRGNGALSPATPYPVVGQNGAVAVADFDRDGNGDVAVTDRIGTSVNVFLGKRDGTIVPTGVYETGHGPSDIEAADLNRDGFLDLVTCNQESGTVSALLGAGDGTFAKKRDSHAGVQPIALAVGDFNLDGRPDVVVADVVPGSTDRFLTVLPGLGDGTSGDGLRTPFKGYPFSLSIGDWNWDGALDLAITDITGPTVQTFSGRGDGTFASAAIAMSAPALSYPYGIAAGDLNGDGNTDLVVADVNFARLAVLFGNGAGGFASPVFLADRNAPFAFVAIGNLNSDARPDIVGLGVGVYLNSFPARSSVETRAFVEGGHRTIPSRVGVLCIRMEPVDGSYENNDMDLTSITLRSEGTGSVSEIHCTAAKTVREADTDRNGIAEIGACFSQPDLGAIFDQLRGRTTISAQLSGSLTDGRMFCTDLELSIVGTGEVPNASFAPNPLNPQSTLTFTTGREGPAKALLFDIHGRLVRTLLNTPLLATGRHEFSFDGKSDRGTQLPSSVYFYRVESTEGFFGGRIVILK